MTHLARLRGWSTAQPLSTAIRYAKSWSGTINSMGLAISGMRITCSESCPIPLSPSLAKAMTIPSRACLFDVAEHFFIEQHRFGILQSLAARVRMGRSRSIRALGPRQCRGSPLRTPAGVRFRATKARASYFCFAEGMTSRLYRSQVRFFGLIRARIPV